MDVRQFRRVSSSICLPFICQSQLSLGFIVFFLSGNCWAQYAHNNKRRFLIKDEKRLNDKLKAPDLSMEDVMKNNTSLRSWQLVAFIFYVYKRFARK